MKSAGHVAYDAFREQAPLLPAWDDQTESMRQAWERLAQETMTAADKCYPAPSV